MILEGGIDAQIRSYEFEKRMVLKKAA